jgi:membrane associated rhomboid family serine protease
MDIVLLDQHWAAILCICIMIGAIFLGIIKKFMMTHVLIVSNIVIFVITWIFFFEIVYGFENGLLNYAGLGFRSIYLSSEYFPQIYTLFTSMFIHGGFAHIFGNMIVFFFIGLPFEQRIGWKNFLIIYLVTGVCGALTHSLLNLGSAVPLIGASGAIFGILGAFGFSYPRDEVVMPIGIIIMFLTKIKVIYAVIFFAALETVVVWLDVEDSTAHFAHLGGLVSGIILAAILLRKQKTHTKLGKTIYYDSFSQQRSKEVDISKLKKFATTQELKEMLNRIENETVPQVKDVWLEYFFEKAICPKCNNPLYHFEGKIWCEHCGFRTSY